MNLPFGKHTLDCNLEGYHVIRNNFPYGCTRNKVGHPSGEENRRFYRYIVECLDSEMQNKNILLVHLG